MWVKVTCYINPGNKSGLSADKRHCGIVKIFKNSTCMWFTQFFTWHFQDYLEQFVGNKTTKIFLISIIFFQVWKSQFYVFMTVRSLESHLQVNVCKSTSGTSERGLVMTCCGTLISRCCWCWQKIFLPVDDDGIRWRLVSVPAAFLVTTPAKVNKKKDTLYLCLLFHGSKLSQIKEEK